MKTRKPRHVFVAIWIAWLVALPLLLPPLIAFGRSGAFGFFVGGALMIGLFFAPILICAWVDD